MTRFARLFVLLVGVVVGVSLFPNGSAVAAEPTESVAVVDPGQGLWWLRDAETGSTTSFYYGVPGDTPFFGDWDCDGVDTPGLYRRSDGYVYLRNANTQGVAHVSYFFGNPGDIPLAGDFDGNGCDTVSLYRPSDGRFYVINELGSGDAGLGAADLDYPFGNPGDTPFVGDFDGDGIDTFGMRRRSTGRVYLNNGHRSGAADRVFIFGDPGDQVLAGDWSGSGADTVGLYRPSNTTFYLSGSNTSGPAAKSVFYGARGFVPVTGRLGPLAGGHAPPVNPPRLVSEFTTYHPANEARNININLIADMVDGAVVMPGEVFSLNDHVGERTTEKGFVAAGAISGGVVFCCDHPANIGGGTSQFTTTLYNAVFFGAYDDWYHRPHSLYFSRYPVVREATLGYPGPDLQFRNDTAFPVTIRTSHTATSVTVQLWGDNEDRKVSTWTDGVVSSSRGGQATVYRTITYANGTSATESWTHTYKVPGDADDEEPPPPPPPPPPPIDPL
ncbi:MAG: VanW family protein [Acidimicrobiia bacterium]|nr:VanW family protein [Acidimicrobiia bacterium]